MNTDRSRPGRSQQPDSDVLDRRSALMPQTMPSAVWHTANPEPGADEPIAPRTVQRLQSVYIRCGDTIIDLDDYSVVDAEARTTLGDADRHHKPPRQHQTGSAALMLIRWPCAEPADPHRLAADATTILSPGGQPRFGTLEVGAARTNDSPERRP